MEYLSNLNEKNEYTEKVIHILTNEMCSRNCKYCCNKFYEMDKLPFVTDEELSRAEVICLTGGEPFEYSSPNNIARYYKRKYKNIKSVYVYTNALELANYLKDGNSIDALDGLNVSIKTPLDAIMFERYIKNREDIKNLSSNLLYVFSGLWKEEVEGFKLISREWQTSFAPATDSIFRRMR